MFTRCESISSSISPQESSRKLPIVPVLIISRRGSRSTAIAARAIIRFVFVFQEEEEEDDEETDWKERNEKLQSFSYSFLLAYTFKSLNAEIVTSFVLYQVYTSELPSIYHQ